MYASLVIGGAGSSHKSIGRSQGWLIKVYYSNKMVLFSLCAFNELFFIACYLLSFSSPVIPLHLNADNDGHGPLRPEVQVDTLLLAKMFPDPFSSAALELARSNKFDKHWPSIVAMGCFPFTALKQVINVVQLVQASQRLARVDVQRRRGMKQ
ncbi:hypothetical protein ACHAPE_001044 [Trichoderma viride]